MIALNLTATTAEQTILKDYLENNVSEILADKINNGVKIVKDGKTLINKKDLTTFMKYACEEAQKQAEKGARSACIEDKTVFGWAIHFFEEDSIEGILYNEDGTEHKPPKPAPHTNTTKTATATATVITPPKEKPKTQFSLFDMLAAKPEEKQITKETEIEATDEPQDDETELDEPITEIEDDEPEQLTQISETKWADKDGVVHEVEEVKKDNIPSVLIELFGSTLIMR